MPLQVFRERFLQELQSRVPDNLSRYRRNKSFIASGELAKASIATKLDIDKVVLLEPDGEDLKDLENSIRMHKALPALTPLQARDPRLWVRLAHVELWQYMRRRWEVERYRDDAAKSNRFVINRYFVSQTQGRALIRHGIARLWWYAHLTHDPDRNNPYELTSALLATLDITQQLVERNYGRSRSVLGAFLDFLMQNPGLMDSGGSSRALIRDLAKQLNLYGGVALLDCLTKSQITAILEEEMGRMALAGR
jgi:hypothetical protein